jgi:hypothetical protein
MSSLRRLPIHPSSIPAPEVVVPIMEAHLFHAAKNRYWTELANVTAPALQAWSGDARGSKVPGASSV